MEQRNDNGVPRRKPVPPPPQPSQLDPDWASKLTQQFRRTLSTKRMNELSRRPGSQRVRPSPRVPTEYFVDRRTAPPLPPSSHAYDASTQSPQEPRAAPSIPPPAESPPASSSLKNLPTIPTAPSDPKSLRFRSMLLSLSHTPCEWENPGLLDEALGAIPLQRIYDAAQEEADLFAAEAASMGPNIKPAWKYQDCVIRALMKWFKREFFEWVNNPLCSLCRTRTIACGMAAPLPDEQARGAGRVELYQCANRNCLSYERFPRYNDAFVLLQTRRGRVGEWATCFGMLCRAVGSRVRWVWNAEDHVWTEIYSVHRKRWVHVDCCEEQWDAPLLYTQGWRKKLSYVIAFSADGCCDVTRRYVRDPQHSLARTRCTEGVLMHVVREIKDLRRRDKDKKENSRLNADDMREDAELRRVIIEALALNVSRILPGGIGAPDEQAEAQKAAERAAEAAALEQAWTRTGGQRHAGPGRDPRGQ